jgi:hypothetical protein
MTIFDLIFLALVMASLLALAAVVGLVVSGRRHQTVKVVIAWMAGIGLYLVVVAAVSLVSPQRVLALGENRCSDDWCIAVENAARSGTPLDPVVTVTFRLSSRARRVSQREHGVAVYAIDEKGRRFEPRASPSAPPFDVLLQPGESVTTNRTFEVSGATGQMVLVFGREGTDSIPGRFIIGDDSSLFHKPTIVRLP